MPSARTLKSWPSFLAGLVLLGSLSFTDSASGQDPADAATAQALYDQARDLMKQGDYEPACKKLEESQRLDPGVGTTFWLAECYEKSHRLASAWTLYLEVASLAADAGHESREQVARERAADVLLRVPRLTIELQGRTPQGMELRRNGRLIGEAQIGAPLPVNGGEHVLELSAPGYFSTTITVYIQDNDAEKRVVVPELVKVDSKARAEAVGPPPRAEGPSWWNTRGTWQKVGLVSAGSGALAATGGGILGLIAAGKSRSAECDAENNCTEDGKDARDSALNMGTAATVLVIAGGSFVIAGLSLYFLAPEAGSAKVALSPTPGGVQLWGTW